MSLIVQLFSRPLNIFLAGSFALFAGLLARSCVPAATGIFMPLCNGDTMLLQTGSAAMVHCAGCYVALAGFLIMIAGTVWGNVHRFMVYAPTRTTA